MPSAEFTRERVVSRAAALEKMERCGAERVSPNLYRVGRYFALLIEPDAGTAGWQIEWQRNSTSYLKPPETDYVA